MIHWIEAHAFAIAGLGLIAYMIMRVVETCRLTRAGRDDE
jgi:hypothetical protein